MTKWTTLGEQWNVPDLLKYTHLKSSKVLPLAPSPSVDPGVRCHWIEVKPPMYLWSKIRWFLMRKYLDMKSLTQRYSNTTLFWPLAPYNTLFWPLAPPKAWTLVQVLMLSEKWLSRYGLVENVDEVWGERECIRLGWYNSSLALHEVELKILKNVIFRWNIFNYIFLIQGFISSHKQCTHKTL